jgi:hypothetical protein
LFYDKEDYFFFGFSALIVSSHQARSSSASSGGSAATSLKIVFHNSNADATQAALLLPPRAICIRAFILRAKGIAKPVEPALVRIFPSSNPPSLARSAPCARTQNSTKCSVGPPVQRRLRPLECLARDTDLALIDRPLQRETPVRWPRCWAKQSSFHFPKPKSQQVEIQLHNAGAQVLGRAALLGRPPICPFRHHRSERGAPNITSAMRARVLGVVSSGASREKKPCAAISLLGTGTRAWRKERTTTAQRGRASIPGWEERQKLISTLHT